MTAELDRSAVSARAHQIWLSKGRREGHSVEDWLQAEREIRGERAASPAPAAGAPPSTGKTGKKQKKKGAR